MGVCGAQGSGKSTLTSALCKALGQTGLRVASLSLDDLYLGRQDRRRLADEIHPLFMTRGPPGTHDLELGLAVLAGILDGRSLRLPVFDKATDDRAPLEAWPWFDGPADVLLFEGWCVGARPQSTADLQKPVNNLERMEDPQRIWRMHANQMLDAYQPLFDCLDALIFLKAPDFDVVASWRAQQEEGLRLARGDGPGVMDRAALARFVQHYERLTRHILAEMPARADVVVELGRERQVQCVDLSNAAGSALGFAGA